jgi:hypothetical protein
VLAADEFQPHDAPHEAEDEEDPCEENCSSPVIIAYATVEAAPMPTQTAYAVPVGMSRSAHARPHARDEGDDEDERGGELREALGATERRRPDGFENARDDEDDPRHDVTFRPVLSLTGY